MKFLYFILTISIITNNMIAEVDSISKTYRGVIKHEFYEENCLLNIGKDSVVNFIFYSEGNVSYSEFKGTLFRIHDSTYHVVANLILKMGQFRNGSPLHIAIEDSSSLIFNSIKIIYANGKSLQVKTHNDSGSVKHFIKTPLNRGLFDHKKGIDYVNLVIDQNSYFSKKNLTFRIPFGSGPSFHFNDCIEFDVVIKGDILFSNAQVLSKRGLIDFSGLKLKALR